MATGLLCITTIGELVSTHAAISSSEAPQIELSTSPPAACASRNTAALNVSTETIASGAAARSEASAGSKRARSVAASIGR